MNVLALKGEVGDSRAIKRWLFMTTPPCLRQYSNRFLFVFFPVSKEGIAARFHYRRLITVNLVARQHRALVWCPWCWYCTITSKTSICFMQVKYAATKERLLSFSCYFVLTFHLRSTEELRLLPSLCPDFSFFAPIFTFRLCSGRERKGLPLCHPTQSTINKAQQFNCITKDYRSALSLLPA